jgi:hypothetical protein
VQPVSGVGGSGTEEWFLECSFLLLEWEASVVSLSSASRPGSRFCGQESRGKASWLQFKLLQL